MPSALAGHSCHQSWTEAAAGNKKVGLHAASTPAARETAKARLAIMPRPRTASASRGDLRLRGAGEAFGHAPERPARTLRLADLAPHAEVLQAARATPRLVIRARSRLPVRPRCCAQGPDYISYRRDERCAPPCETLRPRTFRNSQALRPILTFCRSDLCLPLVAEEPARGPSNFVLNRPLALLR